MRIVSTISAALIAAICAAASTSAHGVGPVPSLFLAQAIPQSTPEVQPRAESRDQYVHENEGRFEEWGRKIDALNAKAAERTSGARQTAKREFDKAWVEAKDGWAKLKTASRESWQEAKQAFEQSWRKLEKAWEEAQP